MNKVGIKVFVNLLTVFRFIFAFILPFLIDKVEHVTFICIIAMVYFTDWIDGFVSRKCNAQTLFGSLMDTIADKALCIMLIVSIINSHVILYAMVIGELIIATINLLRNCNRSNN